MNKKYSVIQVSIFTLLFVLATWVLSGCSLLGMVTTTEAPVINPAGNSTENPVEPVPAESQAPQPLVVTQVYAQVEVPAHSTGEASVECPSGSVVLSGGYASNSPMPVFTSEMYGNGWDVFGENTADVPIPLNAYAVCLQTASATSAMVYQLGNLPANGSASTQVTCPEGSLVTGGGYVSSLLTLPFTSMVEGNGWVVGNMNKTSSEAPVSVNAVCLSGINGTLSMPFTQTTLAVNASGVAAAGCAEGAVLVGGGFASEGLSIIYNSSMDEGSKQWTVFAQDLGSGDLINSYAICLSQQ